MLWAWRVAMLAILVWMGLSSSWVAFALVAASWVIAEVWLRRSSAP
jgi:hypothetical protein